MTQCIRSPICVVVGHVDHGKSSVLDWIRSSNIVSSEAGGITQAIGASIIPLEVIKQKCGTLLDKMKLSFSIPGLLFIDTPGHAAFGSLRKRGGSIADIAIVVVDVREGCMPQTIESIKILKEAKTPFVVAVNKIDAINGYKTCEQQKTTSILANIQKQSPEVITRIETQMYTVVQQLYELGFPCERFDRVADFSKEVALIPISARVGDGMSELLMVITALTQKYLEEHLKVDVTGTAKGSILEVKEVQGMGTVIDAIIYDGTMNTNDIIVIGDLSEPIVTKIRGLFVPSTLKDMRDEKSKYKPTKSVCAATGVRICAPGLDRVKSGMPLATATEQTIESVQTEIMQQLDAFKIELDTQGIVIKADTIGSLEAMMYLLREEKIPVRAASVGQISKKDILDAKSNIEKAEEYAVILGFNIAKPDDIKDKDIRLFVEPVIYKLVDDYKAFKADIEKKRLNERLAQLPAICKVQFLHGCSFRQNNPAIFGIHVHQGVIKINMPLIKADLSRIGYVKGLQHNKQSLSQATKEMEVALSVDGITIGRQIAEGDYLYTQLSEEEYLKFKDYTHLLTAEQKDLLKEIAELYRKINPVWGLG